MHSYLSIDIGGTKTIVGLVSETGTILAQRKFASHRTGAEILQEIIRQGTELLSAPNEVTACGIGFGGPVDFRKQQLVKSIHVSGWDNIDLCSVLRQAFGVPCFIDNDANVAALGERTFGAGKQVDTFVYMTVSTGIGGGLVVGGRLHRGHYSMAGEIGHLQVENEGRLCACGRRGCLEAYASGWALVERAKEALPSNPSSSLQTSVANGTISAQVIFAQAQKGDDLAQQLVYSAIHYIAKALVSVINLVDPEMIVIGGGIAKAGSALFQPLNAVLSGYLTYPIAREIACVPAALGGESVLLGAAALAASMHNDGVGKVV